MCICYAIHIRSGLDLGLGSCPGASTTKGPPHMSCHLFMVWYSKVGWASTTKGPPHMSCHLFMVWYSKVGWASTAQLLKAPRVLHVCISGPASDLIQRRVPAKIQLQFSAELMIAIKTLIISPKRDVTPIYFQVD